jgi:UDPglucose--hexose-1-phosphate uridylyltransferase
MEKKPRVTHVEPKDCTFCPGNESLTPPEIGRMRNDGKWKIRWFPNKFNFVDKLGNPKIRTDNEFFTFSDAYGRHEVIAETPDHNKQMTDLTKDELADVLRVYGSRIDELMAETTTKYVSIFKNSGTDAGTSIEHSHTQVVSLNMIPPVVMRKIDAVKKTGSCPYCRILNIEKTSFRRCFENESFVSFTPYASRFNYEIWVFPKNHYKSFMDISDDDIILLADMLKNVLSKLGELGADFNIAFFYSPKGEDLHFHIEVYPRIARWAGFELEDGIYVNNISPEDAAKFYRGEK